MTAKDTAGAASPTGLGSGAAASKTQGLGAGAGGGDAAAALLQIMTGILQLVTLLLSSGGQPGGQTSGAKPATPGAQPGGQTPVTPGVQPGGQTPVTPGVQPGGQLGGQTPATPGLNQTPGALQTAPGGGLGPNPPDGLKQFSKEIETASAASGIPANVLGGMIWQESRGNLQAVSQNGGNGLTDTGLMQVNPNTYKELQQKYPELQGRDNLADPQTNILAGAFYMKDQMEKFGSLDLALRAYNSGPNGVDVNNPDATPAGTGDPTYVGKVKNFANLLASGGQLPP